MKKTALLSLCVTIFWSIGATVSDAENDEILNLVIPVIIAKPDRCNEATTDGSLFEISPIPLENIAFIEPLGALNPSSGHVLPTDHIYFYLKTINGIPIETPFLSPTDITIVSIGKKEHLTKIPTFTDYRIVFSVNDNVSGYFSHVSQLSSSISNNLNFSQGSCWNYETGGETFSQCYLTRLGIKISKGEQIGMIGGNPAILALDAYLTDKTRNQLDWANPIHYIGSDTHDNRYVRCILDYYNGDLKYCLEKKIGGYGGMRTVAPICGQVEQDEPGTAQGNWFTNGSVEYSPEDRFISLVHDSIDPTLPIISIGRTSNVLTTYGKYSFNVRLAGMINRDFNKITSGNIYCYDNLTTLSGYNMEESILLIQLIDNNTLRIEKLNDSNCQVNFSSWGFTNNAKTFSR